MVKNKIIREMIDKIDDFCRRRKLESYFVGGFLRDLLLDREINDIDVVIKIIKKTESVGEIAREFSNKTKGSLVPLDEKNDVYRVVYSGGLYLDFSRMRGQNIKEDLSIRDFTINAIALPVADSFHIFSACKYIIDYGGGKSDLKSKKIKMVNKEVFDEDPLRLLRAYRLSAVLGFKIENLTKKLIKQKSFLINKVAGERVRDEFFKILEIDESYQYIFSLGEIGLLTEIFPEIDIMKNAVDCYYHQQGLWEHSLETLNSLEEIFLKLSVLFPQNHSQLIKYLEKKVTDNIKRKSVLKIGAIFHDIGKPATLKIIDGKVRFLGHEAEGFKLAKRLLQRLKISNKMIKIVEKIILHHMRPGNLASVPQLTDRAISRFFTELGEDGVGVLLVSLADHYSYRKVKIKRNEMKKQLMITSEMLGSFYQRRKKFLPRPFLKGDDLMRIFGLSEGPQIGKLLKLIVEAQVEGEIKTKKKAIDYVKNFIEKKH
jgi:poly(A) polymerase